MNYPVFKARCSAIWSIMSDPQWKSPKQKYLDKLTQLQTEEQKYNALEKKESKTAQNIRDKIQRYKDELWELEKNKDEVMLSKTCIWHLEDWIKEHYYWRRKVLKTKAIIKWIECETEAIHILNKASWTSYKKSVYNHWEKMENERCTWHEDIDAIEWFPWRKWKWIIDTKVCESFDTFPILDKDFWDWYRWQWLWYMRLKWEEYQRHWIAKVLVNTPARQIKNELFYMYNNLLRKYEDNPEIADMEYDIEAREYFNNHVFDKQLRIESNWSILQLEDSKVIPYEKRINIQFIERDDEAINSIAERVQLCRQYLHQKGYKQREDKE